MSRHSKSILSAALSMAALVMAVTCGSRQGSDDIQPGQVQGPLYTNPVIKDNCPDPSIIDNRERDGYFYLYSTRNGDNSSPTVVHLPVYRSKDMLEWEPMGNAFGGLNRPEWVPGSSVWAPDINYIDGKYVLYYALGCWGEPVRSASGVAVSASPTGPFTDLGMLVDYASQGVSNSIDPNFFDDGERKYLFWGSLGEQSGIWAIELSSDGLSVKEGAQKVKIGASDMEGTYIHKRGEWYYAFTSMGSCCNGESSTYHVVVGRSKNVLGPYQGPDGKLLTDSGFNNTILEGNRLFRGPGHNAEILTDDAGRDWMFFHAYCKTTGYNGRSACLERVYWGEDGWPYFKLKNVSPSGYGPVWD